MGVVGGMAWGAIPAYLRNRFNANEILTSLMLVYVAQLLLDWLVRGPWRDPQGFNFPKSITFSGWQLLALSSPPAFMLGVVIALIVALALGFVMARTLKGFEITRGRPCPRAPRASAGFSEKRTVMFCFLLSGGLAGLAGAMEVASRHRTVAAANFAGLWFRRHHRGLPWAAQSDWCDFCRSAAGAELYRRRSRANCTWHIPTRSRGSIQGILLFFVLACDTLILYRIAVVPSEAAESMDLLFTSC